MEQFVVDVEECEAAQALKKCGRCGGTSFEGGHMMIPHSGELVFRLFKTSASQRFPNITVTAEICLSCGALEFTADPEKARELLK
jgi:predicted nucleic-acid-binding Zn-ribbon protein